MLEHITTDGSLRIINMAIKHDTRFKKKWNQYLERSQIIAPEENSNMVMEAKYDGIIIQIILRQSQGKMLVGAQMLKRNWAIDDTSIVIFEGPSSFVGEMQRRLNEDEEVKARDIIDIEIFEGIYVKEAEQDGQSVVWILDNKWLEQKSMDDMFAAVLPWKHGPTNKEV